MEMSGRLHAQAPLLLAKESPVPTGWEARWATEPVWMLWTREKYLALAENPTSVIQPEPIAILTDLYQLLRMFLLKFCFHTQDTTYHL
jgi:hypothetical protein